jgi:hypothetical protein
VSFSEGTGCGDQLRTGHAIAGASHPLSRDALSAPDRAGADAAATASARPLVGHPRQQVKRSLRRLPGVAR